MTERIALELLDWGLLGYGEALDRQRALVEERLADRAPDRLVFVEHPPVITLGRSGSERDLCASREFLRHRGVEVFQTERGGQATCHEPGQMVAYPILKLLRRDLHAFVRDVLDAAAEVLREYGLVPELRTGVPGLWVSGAKVASLGVAVRRWVTYHGLALNVNNRLDTFRWIVPCGNPSERMTSLETELGYPVSLGEVRQSFAAQFLRRFGYEGGTRRDPLLA